MAAATERLGVMRVLVDQLFEYAKAVSDDRALTREPVDVAERVGGVPGRAVPLFRRARLAPEVAADEAVGSACRSRSADAHRGKRAGGTALRHGSGAPRIELHRAVDPARPSDTPRLACDGATAGCSGFALSISNEAEGLEALDVSRLFERFYRGDAARSTGGSGLGLAIAADLAHAMGMSLEATVPDGRFTVTLWR